MSTDESANLEISKDEILDQKVEKEKKELLANVLSGNILSLRDKVGYILNRYSDTRNSDIELAWRFWETFESHLFNGSSITKGQMYNLTKANSLIRSRAKIQNEYKLFQADDNVRKYRGVLEEEQKSAAIQDKPQGIPSYTVFIDETGKTHDFLLVGSLWLVEGGLNSYYFKREIEKWKEQNSINYEFHFAELSRTKLDVFREFFAKFLLLNSTAGFKIIGVRKSGFRDLSQPITDLTFHLLNKGIAHENTSNRARLPRILQVWLDEEEEGSDSIKLENLKERITAQNIDGLYLDNFHAVSSESNYYIQAVDLFTASVNRKINISPSNRNHKDDLADYILELTGFDTEELDIENNEIDNSVVFSLSNFNTDNTE